MKRLSTLLVSGLLLAASSAFGAVESNKTPTQMGIRPGNGTAYFFVAEALTTVCQANVIWITLDAAGMGKTAYATVLAAKVTGKKIAYLEYTKNEFNNCYLVQVDIAQ